MGTEIRNLARITNDVDISSNRTCYSRVIHFSHGLNPQNHFRLIIDSPRVRRTKNSFTLRLTSI